MGGRIVEWMLWVSRASTFVCAGMWRMIWLALSFSSSIFFLLVLLLAHRGLSVVVRLLSDYLACCTCHYTTPAPLSRLRPLQLSLAHMRGADRAAGWDRGVAGGGADRSSAELTDPLLAHVPREVPGTAGTLNQKPGRQAKNGGATPDGQEDSGCSACAVQ